MMDIELEFPDIHHCDYFDFSGYSDMAIGIARLFGITLPVNFNSPYKSRFIIDFWRRWHMTLSRFLRDYLYIPLGGSRAGTSQRYRNLAITMTLGGLWHGADWTFVVWGALHGVYLIINQWWRSRIVGGRATRAGTARTSDGRVIARLPRLAAHGLTLLCNEHSQQHYWLDYQSALISTDAIQASLAVNSTRRAIKRALAAGAATHYSEDAQGRLGPVPAIDTHRILTGLGARTDAEVRSRLSDGGHRSNTLKIEKFFTGAVYLPAPLRQFQFATADEDSLYWYEQFIRTLHENNIRASLAISPSHARLNELIDAAGLWSQWETWKRSMLSINPYATSSDVSDYSIQTTA